MIGVDEIDPYHGVTHPLLIGSGRRQIHVLILKDFGPAGLVNADGFHGVLPQMLTEEIVRA